MMMLVIIQLKNLYYFQININDGIKIMEKNLIWDIPVVDENGFLLGLLHLQGFKKNHRFMKWIKLFVLFQQD